MSGRNRRTLAVAGMVVALVAWRISLGAVVAATWQKGDVFAGVANGRYFIYHNGVLVDDQTIVDTANTSDFTTGCGFNNDFTKLYTTSFDHNQVTVYDNATHALLTHIPPNPAPVADGVSADGSAQNESVAFDHDGNLYVGHAGDGSAGNATSHIFKYSPAGVLLKDWAVDVEFRGTDWIDVTSDGTTIYYTSEGAYVHVFSTVTETNLTNFNDGFPMPGSIAYALRALPDGSMLVANNESIVRLDASDGHVIKEYDAPGQDRWFALNRDPDGLTFWSADLATGHIFRFEIDGNGLPILDINTGQAGFLAGLCVKGELTAPPIITVSACPNPHTPPAGDALGYPDTSNPPRSQTTFNESTVLKGYGATNDALGIVAWYSDEHPLSLGVRKITNAKTKAVLCEKPVDGFGNPAVGAKPAVGCTTADPNGEPGASDPSKRPIRPVLFFTDLGSDPHSTLRTGDWQQGAALHNEDGIPPSELYGTWKGGTSTVNVSTGVVVFTPDSDSGIHKNAWPSTPNLTVPIDPSTGKVLRNEGFSSAIVWNTLDLKDKNGNTVVVPGHSYRFQFMVHDGDQNKSGGDSGEGCVVVTYGQP